MTNVVEAGTVAVQPSEATALLPARPSQSVPEHPPLPLVEPVILRVLSKGITSCTDVDLCPTQLNSRAAETAFSLIVLLYARNNATYRNRSRQDVLERWHAEQQQVQDLHSLDQRVYSLWNTFLSQCHSEDEIEVALWTAFPYEKPGYYSKRVIDFLCDNPMLEDLRTHPVVLLSARRIWRRGRIQDRSEESVPARLLRRLDRLGTPRVMHAIDLTMLLWYMGVLAHFLILPPSHAVDPTTVKFAGNREWMMIVYALAKLYDRPRFSILPHVLVLGSFIAHLPRVPHPEDFAFGILLFAFSWMVVDLHLPWSTSPLHLVPAELILPRSVLILHGVSRVFLPVVTFFLPALLLSLFLLSTSLADLFPNSVAIVLAPSPMESRIAFLSLFAVLFLLMICSLIMLITVYPTFASKAMLSPWDKYSRPIGLEARRFYIRTVVQYSDPYFFPAPFNALRLLIRLPEMVATVFGDRGSASRVPAISLLERVVWRVTMAPLAVVFGAIWLWGWKS